MTTDAAHITAICRYPVKGFTPEPMERVALRAGRCLPLDRAYAVENGTRDFDPRAPRHFPKVKFLQLMRHERLALLTTRLDDESRRLVIERDGRQVASGALDTPVGRQLIEQFLASFLKDELRGPPRIVACPGHSFSDVSRQVVSIINLATVRDIERVAGQPVDPLRFRGNLYIDGLEPWAELGWVGETVGIAGAPMLKALEPIKRCAATEVDPQTAARDLKIPQILQRGFGHQTVGIYAEVTADGTVAVGEAMSSGTAD